MATLREIEGKLIEGLKADKLRLTAVKLPSRLPHVLQLQLFAERKGEREHLLYAKLYMGRGHYRPWVELSGINPLPLGMQYFNSALEDALLSLFSSALGPGEHIFVSYVEDLETKRALYFGTPVPATRLGFKLFTLGFTWFKDWYFPEGLKEGGEKLQAEKPLSEEQKREHLEEIRAQLISYLESSPLSKKESERARAVLNVIEREMRD